MANAKRCHCPDPGCEREAHNIVGTTGLLCSSKLFDQPLQAVGQFQERIPDAARLHGTGCGFWKKHLNSWMLVSVVKGRVKMFGRRMTKSKAARHSNG